MMIAERLEVATGLFIGGAWIDRPGAETFGVVDPGTGATIAHVADGTPGDARAAVDAAADAAPAWAQTAPRERAEILRRAFTLMTEREAYFAELIVRENGKAFADALGETRYAAEFFRWYAEEAVRNFGSVATAPSGANRMLVLRQPIGIAVLVTPWNFPAAMATRKIGPALAAGCTMVLKPAEETPLTALAIAGLLAEAGLPPGVLNVLPTQQPAEVVDAMLRDPRVRKLSFTGSTDVGRLLLRAAAGNIISCAMELGGNAPFVVFDDADLDAAVAGAMLAKMRNGGEACTAANRIYVERGIAPDFVRAFTAAMAQQRVGYGMETGINVGPLVSAAARDKVGELVDDAVGSGARVMLGGAPLDRPGFFYAPTVLCDVAPHARLLHEEIFGPVAPVVTFDGIDEAVALANQTEYGLVAYVYTRDLAKGLRVAERIEAGMIGLNRGLVSDPAAPFGGVKQSGLGREGGHDGMLEFLETKYIATNW
jgi:succinate-semialdehyde dehydrogenase/glutarate-semialdehyde dehydrogenase